MEFNLFNGEVERCQIIQTVISSRKCTFAFVVCSFIFSLLRAHVLRLLERFLLAEFLHNPSCSSWCAMLFNLVSFLQNCPRFFVWPKREAVGRVAPFQWRPAYYYHCRDVEVLMAMLFRHLVADFVPWIVWLVLRVFACKFVPLNHPCCFCCSLTNHDTYR
jgi:hypothetical protein